MLKSYRLWLDIFNVCSSEHKIFKTDIMRFGRKISVVFLYFSHSENMRMIFYRGKRKKGSMFDRKVRYFETNRRRENSQNLIRNGNAVDEKSAYELASKLWPNEDYNRNWHQILLWQSFFRELLQSSIIEECNRKALQSTNSMRYVVSAHNSSQRFQI